MVNFYVVYMKGVYTQEIRGVFDSEEGARLAAITAIQREKDDYHDVIVAIAPLNGLVNDLKILLTIKRKIELSITRTDSI